ncbi:MAG: GAF domain-containing sensor histidine kinase, partial [Planctomycetota bacterium]|nr:GAF domain-containing sensor histidine kinase [Planctomycetota bacterium]
ELSWAVVTQVLATGRPAVYRDAVASEELAGHRSVSALHLRSLACVPVLGKERALGALYLDHASVAALFNSEDLRLLAFIAGLVSQALGVEELETQAAESLKALDEAHRHLLRTERNRLAGELASGLAHDLKNLVAAIAARAELLGRKAQDEKTAKSLATIEKAAWTGSTMLERLQECSRVHENTPRQRVELAEIARDAVDLMSYRFAKQGRQDSGGISVDLKIEEEVSVVAVPGELRELFLNLFVNACEAMPDGGDLRVRIGRGGDAQAQIEVSDTGVGIPPDVLKTIFKPFFTTKGSSGTGLGLSVVRGIILRCGGSVTVESDVGSGSTFRVVLPLAGEQVRT